MTVEPSASSPSKPVGLPVASLIASALATWFIIGVLPVSSHADDWPGPGVGAAIGLQGAGIMAFAATVFAVIAWRPPNAAGLSTAALCVAVAAYFAVGIIFPFVGFAPFCGQNASALAGAPESEVNLQSMFSGCGLFMSAQYLVPLVILGLVILRKAKKAAPSV